MSLERRGRDRFPLPRGGRVTGLGGFEPVRLRDLLLVGLALGLTQGGLVLAQLAIARLVGPAAFGAIRVAEVAISIVWVAAAAGLASAVLRYSATAAHAESSAEVAGVGLRWGLSAAIVLAAGISLAAGLLPLTAAARLAVRVGVWAVVPVAITRTLVNLYQGRREPGRAAALAAVAAGLFLLTLVLPTWYGGFDGWLAARVPAEVVPAAVLLWLARRDVTWSGSPAVSRSMLRYGALITGSLLLDRVTTTADSLYLDLITGDPVVVGEYGVAMLLVTTPLLLSATVATYALPRLARAAKHRDQFQRVARAIFLPGAAVVGVVGLLLWIGGGEVVTLAFGTAYGGASRLVRPLLPVFVGGAFLSFGGTMLLALDRPGVAAVQSAVGMGVNVAANLATIPRLGVDGAVLAAQLTVGVRMAVLAAGLWWCLRPPGRLT